MPGGREMGWGGCFSLLFLLSGRVRVVGLRTLGCSRTGLGRCAGLPVSRVCAPVCRSRAPVCRVCAPVCRSCAPVCRVCAPVCRSCAPVCFMCAPVRRMWARTNDSTTCPNRVCRPISRVDPVFPKNRSIAPSRFPMPTPAHARPRPPGAGCCGCGGLADGARCPADGVCAALPDGVCVQPHRGRSGLSWRGFFVVGQ
jgi:hypothetical protein